MRWSAANLFKRVSSSTCVSSQVSSSFKFSCFQVFKFSSFNDDTGELLCNVTADYGDARYGALSGVFNERGYLAIPPCLFGYQPGLRKPFSLGPTPSCAPSSTSTTPTGTSARWHSGRGSRCMSGPELRHRCRHWRCWCRHRYAPARADALSKLGKRLK